MEYSDIQSDLMTEEGQEDMLLLAYEKFILHHDWLTDTEQNEYWSALHMSEQLKWAE